MKINMEKLNVKRFSLSMIIALTFTIVMSFAGFSAQCQEIRDSVLRLHILANSDSTEDQSLKLAVRDRIIEETGDLFSTATTKNDAIKIANDNISLLQSIAEKEIAEQGYDYAVTVSVEKTDFNTRIYDEVTLPAGEYTAVRVLIGQANGKNWWCVMFPQMCVPAASESKEMADVVDDNQLDIVENSDKYEIKFKTVEIYEKVRAWFN